MNKINSKKLKIFIIILLLLIVPIGGYQVYNYSEGVKSIEDVEFFALEFGTPMEDEINKVMSEEVEVVSNIIDNNSNKIGYSDIKNYIKDNLQGYKDYHNLNPELLEAEVIWRVNVGLDREFYENIKTIEDPSSISVVVNKYNKLPSGYVPSDMVNIIGEDNQQHLLRLEAKEALDEMIEDMNRVNPELKLVIESSYVNSGYQRTLHTNTVQNLGEEKADLQIARSGHSEHQTGLAIDVSDGKLPYEDFGKTETFQWLENNAHRFGYIIRYKADPVLTGYTAKPWHLRYVGTAIAIDMYEGNIHLLEEYLDKKAEVLSEVIQKDEELKELKAEKAIDNGE